MEDLVLRNMFMLPKFTVMVCTRYSFCCAFHYFSRSTRRRTHVVEWTPGILVEKVLWLCIAWGRNFFCFLHKITPFFLFFCLLYLSCARRRDVLCQITVNRVNTVRSRMIWRSRDWLFLFFLRRWSSTIWRDVRALGIWSATKWRKDGWLNSSRTGDGRENDRSLCVKSWESVLRWHYTLCSWKSLMQISSRDRTDGRWQRCCGKIRSTPVNAIS